MKKYIVGALSAALIAGLPALANAQGSLSISGEEATMICRAARGGEQATAQLATGQALLCRNIEITLEPNEQLRVIGSVTVQGEGQPPFPGLTGDALSRAWTHWFINVMKISYGGA